MTAFYREGHGVIDRKITLSCCTQLHYWKKVSQNILKSYEVWKYETPLVHTYITAHLLSAQTHFSASCEWFTTRALFYIILSNIAWWSNTLRIFFFFCLWNDSCTACINQKGNNVAFYLDCEKKKIQSLQLSSAKEKLHTKHLSWNRKPGAFLCWSTASESHKARGNKQTQVTFFFFSNSTFWEN